MTPKPPPFIPSVPMIHVAKL